MGLLGAGSVRELGPQLLVRGNRTAAAPATTVAAREIQQLCVSTR